MAVVQSIEGDNMKNFILGRIILAIGAALSGYKMYAAGAGFILTGLSALIVAAQQALALFFPDPQNPSTMDIHTIQVTFGGGMLAISTGLKTIGQAHKMEKQTAAVVAQTIAIQATTKIPEADVHAGEVYDPLKGWVKK